MANEDVNKVAQDRNQAQSQEQQRAARRRAEDERRKAAEQQVDQGAKAKEESVRQAHERAENAQPTPTQRENDLAKLGVQVMNKEDDGSGPDVAFVRSVQPVESGAAPYATRDAAPAQSQPRQAPQKVNEPHRAEPHKAGETK